MKIKLENDLLIIYLYSMKLNLDDIESLKDSIKKILIRIIKYYKINFSGIYKVTIYENKFYGYVLELLQIKEFEYGDFIDLKIEIKTDQPFYLLVDNYIFLEDMGNVFYKNGIFFVKFDEHIDLIKKMEYGEIGYKNTFQLTDKSVKIK